MNIKTPVTISVVLTIILLVLIAIFTMIVQMIVLNGVMDEGQAATALGITLGVMGVALILGAVFARWLTRRMITRSNWNRALAVIGTVVVAGVLGVLAGFTAVMSGLLIAGI